MPIAERDKRYPSYQEASASPSKTIMQSLGTARCTPIARQFHCNFTGNTDILHLRACGFFARS